MIRRWFGTASNFVHTIFTMTMMTRQAQLGYLVVFLVVLFLQGLLPLATAWITKAFFDLLGQSILHHQAIPFLVQ